MKRISKSAKNADKEILKLHTGRTQSQRSSLIIVCACVAAQTCVMRSKAKVNEVHLAETRER